MLEKFAAPRTSSHLAGIAQRGIHEYRDVVAGTMRAPRHCAVFHVAEALREGARPGVIYQ
jgi:hypothetical protein